MAEKVDFTAYFTALLFFLTVTLVLLSAYPILKDGNYLFVIVSIIAGGLAAGFLILFHKYSNKTELQTYEKPVESIPVTPLNWGKGFHTLAVLVFVVVGVIVVYAGIFQQVPPNLGIIDQIMFKLTSSTFTSGLTIFGIGIAYYEFTKPLY